MTRTLLDYATELKAAHTIYCNNSSPPVQINMYYIKELKAVHLPPAKYNTLALLCLQAALPKVYTARAFKDAKLKSFANSRQYFVLKENILKEYRQNSPHHEMRIAPLSFFLEDISPFLTDITFPQHKLLKLSFIPFRVY